MAEIGKIGLDVQGGQVDDEFQPQLRGHSGQKVYREMSDNDPIIGGIFFAIDMLLRNVTWRVEAQEGTDDADVEFLEQCIDDMSHSWTDFISEIMSMLVFGWSWFEIVYKRREDENSKYPDGRIGWRKFAFRSQESLDRWDMDDEGGIRAFVQKPAPTYVDLTIPIEKSLLFRTMTRKNNPEGRSVLRNAYRPWFYKKRIEEIEGMGVERDLAGIPMAKLPAEYLDPAAPAEQKAIRNAIETVVKNVRQDRQAGILWPNDRDDDGNELFTFELLSSGGSRAFDTGGIIERYDKRIAMMVLGDFILLGHDRMGSYSLSSDKTDMFAMALGAWLESIEEVINRFAVSRLFELNGAKGKTLPKITSGDIEKPDINRIAQYVQTLSQTGMPIFPDEALEKYLRELGGLPSMSNSGQEEAENMQIEELRQNLMQGMSADAAPQPGDTDATAVANAEAQDSDDDEDDQ